MKPRRKVSVKRAVRAAGLRPTRAQVLEALARIGREAGWGDAAGDRK